MKKMTWVTGLLMALLSISVVFAAFADDVTTSSDIEIDEIEINGKEYRAGKAIPVEVGEAIEIDVSFVTNDAVDNVVVSAQLIGPDYGDGADYFDATRPDDYKADVFESVELELEAPLFTEKDNYQLQIKIDGERGTNYVFVAFPLLVEGAKNSIYIDDVIFSPGNTVVAGRALLTQLRLENLGERDLDDAKITVSIPALGLQAHSFLDEVEGTDNEDGRGERITSEEIYMRIPECAPEGIYQVLIDVEYSRDRDESSTTRTITVLESDLCPNNAPQPTYEKTIITAPQTQAVQAGLGGASFPLVLQNAGNSAKAYQVSVSGVQTWGTAQISDAAPVVGAGETKVVYIYVTANSDAPLGTQSFGIDVSADGQKQTVLAQANITQGESSTDLRNVLQVGVIVLVVILIILGFIVVFAKLRERDDDDMEKGKAYY